MDNIAFALVCAAMGGTVIWFMPHKFAVFTGFFLGIVCMLFRIMWFEGRLLRTDVPPWRPSPHRPQAGGGASDPRDPQNLKTPPRK